MSFVTTGMPKRTDESFRQRVDEEHHRQTTLLEKLSVDMVADFPVADSLHLIDLGIVKKKLVGWRDGTTYNVKWSSRDAEYVTEFLKKCKLPTEIHRATRGIVFCLI